MREATRPLSVAPMMDRTDRHFRWLMRQISRSVLLYTEMETARAVLAEPWRLDLDPEQKPIALQLGGCDPRSLAQCAQWGEAAGYDEIDLNCGCPSPAASSGLFGARLMLEPARVAECVAAMQAVTTVPITVKHRIGVDDRDAYEHMLAFVDIVAQAACDGFIVHARKCWLDGLSPKENRSVPPLRPGEVHRLKAERPLLRIEINGGLRLEDVREQLEHVDGVMIGRAAYDDPMRFRDADALLGRPSPILTHAELAEALLNYASRWVARGGKLSAVTRHGLNAFSGLPGSRAFRRTLSQAGSQATLQTLREALGHLRL